MKLLTYNLRYGGKKKEINSWFKMIDTFSPDIIFAQESHCPRSYFTENNKLLPKGSTTWEATSVGWGSAIYLSSNSIDPISLPNFKGWVVGGRLKQPFMGAKDLFVFSVHTPSPAPYDKKTHKILDAIKEVVGDNEVIIAGDFNMNVALRHPSEDIQHKKSESNFVTRMRKEFGLVNSWQVINPNQNLPQTLRWSVNKIPPFHCDGIFIPYSWVRYIENCEIINTGPWTAMSDHNPIVLSLQDIT